MATASPTPMGQGSHFTSLGRRTSARQAGRRPPSRAPLPVQGTANPAPNSLADADVATGAARSQSQRYSAINDSSDDEIPVPMKLSALTKAILNDGAGSEAPSVAPSAARQAPSPSTARPSSTVMTRQRNVPGTSAAPDDKASWKDEARDRQPARRHARAGSAQLASSRPSSPVRSRESSPAPRKRIVRLSSTAPGIAGAQNSLRRSLSTSTQRRPRPASREKAEERELPQHAQSQSQPLPSTQQQSQEAQPDLSTPAQPVRTVRIAVGSSGNRARSAGSSGMASKPSSGGGAQSDQEPAEDPGTGARAHAGSGQASVTRVGVAGRKDDVGLPSSMRIKRVGKMTGSFLSGPARRGRRRQSEEDADENEGDAPGSIRDSGRHPAAESVPPGQADQAADYLASSFRDFAASGSPVRAKDAARAHGKQSPYADLAPYRAKEADDARHELPSQKPSILAPGLPSALDQENVPAPAVFQKNGGGPQVVQLEKEVAKPFVRPISTDLGLAGRTAAASPERKALALKSQNTPHRPAPPPPPPKMSVVETATKPAGAATTSQGNKKRTLLLRVNNVPYTRIDCLGRGGSSKVYKVAAENGKMYALKRVALENADENTVKGFKGEIDLLKKLATVERVIGLVDYELNVEKQLLSLVMEQGELDLNRLLGMRQNHEGAKLDPVFVRYYWKEMLECVAAVHAFDIVHSDLKPANFVLVQGRLKLIDFGIANAIQTDETVNVHRETQIGTPNYMSPESLMDTNQYAFTSSHNGRFCVPPGLSKGGPKLMKLGKPSDVWSLGCILYQMVYGLPPFGHISNQIARCQAIINWHHAIDFPARGTGGVTVPPSLVRTMRSCLNREQGLRPTCDGLLSSSDPFLYPPEFDVDVVGDQGQKALPITEEILGRIIASVVQRCKERPPTEGEFLSAWPSAYFSSVRKAVETKQTRT